MVWVGPLPGQARQRCVGRTFTEVDGHEGPAATFVRASQCTLSLARIYRPLAASIVTQLALVAGSYRMIWPGSKTVRPTRIRLEKSSWGTGCLCAIRLTLGYLLPMGQGVLTRMVCSLTLAKWGIDSASGVVQEAREPLWTSSPQCQRYWPGSGSVYGGLMRLRCYAAGSATQLAQCPARVDQLHSSRPSLGQQLFRATRSCQGWGA